MNNDEKLLSVIFNVGRLIKGRMCQKKCLAGFTHVEMEVLRFVAENEKTTMKSIADYLYVKPSSVTPLIDNLAKNGNLKRIADKNDRRVLHIILSKKGKKIFSGRYNKIRNNIKKVFSSLSAKDKILLIKILEKI